MKLAWIIIQGALAALIAMSGTANAATGDIVEEGEISDVSSSTNLDNGSVAFTPGGDGVAAWRQEPENNSNTAVFAATYSPISGWGEPFRVSPANSVPVTRPSVATAANGDFVVAWTNQNGAHFQRYNADGSAEGDVRTPSTAADAVPASVAADVDGNFAIGWITGGEVKAARFNADGSPAAGPNTVSNASGTASAVNVGLGAGGELALAWEQDGANHDVYSATATSGVPSGSGFEVAAGLTNEPAVALSSAANGDFVVAWDMAGSSNDKIHARRFQADGKAIDSDSFLASPDTGTFHNPDVAMAARGDFSVAYEETDSDNNVATGVRYFDDTGASVTTVPGHSDAPADQVTTSIAADADGDVLVSSLSDGSENVVFGSILKGPETIDLGVALDPLSQRTNPGATYTLPMSVSNFASESAATGWSAIDQEIGTATAVAFTLEYKSNSLDWSGDAPTGWNCSESEVDNDATLTCAADEAFPPTKHEQFGVDLVGGEANTQTKVRATVHSNQQDPTTANNSQQVIIEVAQAAGTGGGGTTGWLLLLLSGMPVAWRLRKHGRH